MLETPQAWKKLLNSKSCFFDPFKGFVESPLKETTEKRGSLHEQVSFCKIAEGIYKNVEIDGGIQYGQAVLCKGKPVYININRADCRSVRYYLVHNRQGGSIPFWVKKTGLKYGTINSRIMRGFPIEKILSPVEKVKTYSTRKWEQWEIRFIFTNYLNLTCKEIGEHLNRNESSVGSKIKNLKKKFPYELIRKAPEPELPNPNLISKEVDQEILELYNQGLSDSTIRLATGASKQWVQKWRNLKGLEPNGIDRTAREKKTIYMKKKGGSEHVRSVVVKKYYNHDWRVPVTKHQNDILKVIEGRGTFISCGEIYNAMKNNRCKHCTENEKANRNSLLFTIRKIKTLGLLESKKIGRKVYYTIADGAKKIP